MTKEIVYCDRCGQEVKYPITARVRLYGSQKKITILEMTEHDNRIDLCQPCIDSLSDWFNNPANQYKAETEQK